MSLITFDNDAKSCYDRIVMSYCLTLCQRLGLPAGTATAFGAFLDRAQNFLKTKLQTSETPYTSTNEAPLHGPGQGSRVGPPMWLFISSQLMMALEAKHSGLHLNDPTGWIHATRIIDGFVDDTTSIASKRKWNSLRGRPLQKPTAVPESRSYCTKQRMQRNGGNNCFGPQEENWNCLSVFTT